MKEKLSEVNRKKNKNKNWAINFQFKIYFEFLECLEWLKEILKQKEKKNKKK